MLLEGVLAKKYSNWIKVENFISKIKSSTVIIKKFVDDDLKDSKLLIDTKRFDDKSRKLLLELLNSSKLDSKVSKFVDIVPFKDLSSIDTVIDKVIEDLQDDFDKITESVVKIIDKDFPFPDHFVEEIKDEIKNTIQSKVSYSLYKKKKIVSQEFKDYDYNKQIDKFGKFIENLIDDRIKSVTLIIPPSKIIVQGTGTATNGSPLIIDNALK